MIDQHKETFRIEARELLMDLENSLMELEYNSQDMELVAKVFRALHTIKGSGSMFGYDNIASFTHNIENVFDLIRNGQLNVSKEIIDLTLLSKDQIISMVNETSVDPVQTTFLMEKFRLIAEGENVPANTDSSVPSAKEVSSKSGVPVSYFIYFKPSPDVFRFGGNPLLLLRELGELGKMISVALTDSIPVLSDIEPESCYTAWSIFLTTDKSIDDIKDIFIFVEDSSTLLIEVIANNSDITDKFSNEDLLEILSHGTETPAYLKLQQYSKPAVGEDEKSCKQTKINSTEQKEKQLSKSQTAESDKLTSIRVSSDKLDTLVNLVGELVTVHARLNQFAAAHNMPVLTSISEEVERLTWELRDSALNIRMLPIGTTFSRFKRLVRDLSNELGKQVELKTDGAETELDKTVIERLNDPLVHIIRNSIDHGIEYPDERTDKGKSSVGTISLSAAQAGGNVIISIHDDGAGIDKDRIKAKAIANGIIQEDAELKDSEIFALIFAPGFSTADRVTSISGRGVGMDVVKRALEALRGNVEISSQLEVGTTITLKLPLTLAIIEGLLIDVGEDNFIIPLSLVEECIELNTADKKKANGRHLVNVRGELVPYIPLREKFRIDGNVPEIEQVVIINDEGVRTGFVVDRVIGEHQTVIKSLGKYYKEIEGISGATVLGDGSVALILDIPKLVDMAEQEENTRISKL